MRLALDVDHIRMLDPRRFIGGDKLSQQQVLTGQMRAHLQQ